MSNILIINGGHKNIASKTNFNATIIEWDIAHFEQQSDISYKVTHVTEAYDVQEEINKILWADCIIFHFPIWWMYMPFSMKKYLDEVLTAGHKTLYRNDGRKAENPSVNYGTGGLLQGKVYITTTTWNAPESAFTLENEFFDQRSVDDGVLFPFHKMNQFLGLQQLKSFHFHDVSKNLGNRQDILKEMYLLHLKQELIK